MTISLSFSGGISHTSDVPEEKQQEIAEKVAATIKEVVEANYGSGTGSILVGTKNVTVVAIGSGSLN